VPTLGPNETPFTPRARSVSRSQAVTIWTLLVAALGVLTVVLVVLTPPEQNALLIRPFRLMLALLSVGELVGGVVVLRNVRATSAKTAPDGLAGTQMIIGCAMAIGVGLFANVAQFVTGDPTLLAFLVPPAAALAWLFPSASRWAWYTAPGSAAPARGMMRE
jgi:hypothetical protein